MNVKKIRYRLLIFLIIASLTLASLVLAPAVSASDRIAFTLKNVYAERGGTVCVPITISGNTGIAAYRFQLSYDSSNVTFISAENGEEFKNGNINSNYIKSSDVLMINWYSVNDITADGTVAVLKFKLSSSANGKYKISVKYLPEDILNDERQVVPCTVTEGYISIGSTISGTVTSFGGSEEPVTIKLIYDDAEFSRIISTNGKFCFDSVPPGIYKIEASKPRHITYICEVTIGNENIIKDLTIYRNGDVNFDGIIDSNDAVLVLQHNAKVLDLSELQLLTADVDGNNTVDSNDAILLLKYNAKTIDKFPVEK